MLLESIRAQVNLLKNASKAKQMMRFFKTGQGQYGHGDNFVGLSNPQCRAIAADHKNISLKQIQELLNSKIHEQRLIALVLLDFKFKSKKQDNRKQIFRIYLEHMECINNWDLVDLSAPNIVGKYLLQNCKSFKEIIDLNDPRKILYQWVKSQNIWHRRISIISTFTFIRANHFYDTIQLSKILLGDKQDLIHKAVGWMLREIGKRQTLVLQKFISENYQLIPRTSLRYAIQKFEQNKRKQILKGNLSVLHQQ